MAGKPAMLKIDIVTDANDAQKGLQKTGQEAKNAAGDFDELGQAIYNAMAHNGAQISDSAESMEKFGGAAGDASSGVQAVGAALQATGVADFTKQIAVAGAVLDGLEGATRLYTVATQALGVWQKITAEGTKLWAAQQWLLNAAMDANPIGIIVLAVIALIAVIVLLWLKSEAFRTAVLAIWSAMKDAAVAVWDALKAAATAVLSFLQAYIGLWVAGLKLVFTGLKIAATAVWDALKTAALAVFDFLKGYIGLWIAAIKLLFTGLKIAATAVWDALKDSVSGALSWIKGVLQSGIDGFKTIFSNFKTAISDTFDTIKNTVLGPINAVRDAIQEIIDKVQSLIEWFGKIKIPGNLGGLLDKLNPFKSSAPASARSLAASPFGLGASPLANGPLAATAGLLLQPLVLVTVSIGGETLDARVDTRIAAGNAALARRITGRAQVLR